MKISVLRLRLLLVLVYAIACILMLYAVSHAHDPSDADAQWYGSLMVPSAPGSFLGGTRCCDGPNAPHPDCMNVETRQVRDDDGVHLEAWIDSKTFPDTEYSPIYGHAPNDWVSRSYS
jgi:hypothetical protein